MGPKCPPMHYHVAAEGKNRLEGAAFKSGGDAMARFIVTGTIGSDGRVSMDLKLVGTGTNRRHP